MLSQLQLRRALTLLAIFALTAAHPSRAQVQTGTPRFGTFGGGPDIINLGNLNSHLDVPVLHKNGRGLPFDFKFVFDSSVWAPVSVNGSKVWQPSSNWGWGTGGTDIGQVTYTVIVTTIHCIIAGQTFSAPQTTWSNWSYIDGSGTAHPFDGSAIGTGAQCASSGGNQTIGFSTGDADGSGYILNVPGNCCAISVGNVKVTSPTANLIMPLSRTIQDRNGNTITSDGSGHLTDTLGIVAMTTSGASPNPVSYSYIAPSGATASFTQTFKAYTVQTNFGCSGVSEYGATSNSLVDKITLPDLSFYQFTYELTPGSSTNVTGRLASVRFPTGGTISYQYSGGSNGITCSDGSAATLTRTTPDGQWTYARTLGTVPASSTTITDPQGNQTAMQFANLGGTIYQTVEKVYQGTLSSGTLLRSTTTCYDGMTANCATSLFGFPISQKAVTIQLGASGPQCKHVTFYDGGPGTLNTGVTNEQDDYDYGVGAPGAPMKKTVYTYTYSSPPQLKIVQVQNGGGSTIAQTTFSYDETSVVTPSNQPTPQHTNTLPGPRRNLTTVSYGLTEHWTYFDTGQIATRTDTNGAQESSNYSALTATCGNAFPTSISEPLGLSRSMTWNCSGGVQTSVTDENSKTTTTAYSDADFWRPASVTDPLTNATLFAYSASNPTWVVQSLTFNGSQSNAYTGTGFDGLGREIIITHQQSPSGTAWDQVTQSYDSNGRPWKTSVPCTNTGAWTCPTTAKTITYDALNRPLLTTDGGGGTVSYAYSQNDVLVTVGQVGPPPTGESNKRRQLEYDALGRLTSVCEITSATGSGTCGQQTTQTGFWTKYTHDAVGNLTGVTQNAQSSPQTRTYVYDLMGRLTSESNPESGTKTYFYDSDSTMCGNGAYTSKGDLVKTSDAAGNCVMSYYDTLHRLTDIGNSNQAVSHCKRFRYDNSSGISGSTKPAGLVNTLGRLIEAATDKCDNTGDAIITDEWFSYTPRGEISDKYQSSPNSGGYYHEILTYWENGATKQISGLPSLPTFTYGVDGEGRLKSVTASTGQNPLSSASYNAASQATNVNLGSGDSDVFTYDTNTNRMIKYQFNIGTQTFTGIPTWNSNGSFASLSITDPFYAPDTQNCTYSNDDLARISSANCGSAFSQTFSYDAFGNLKKSGTFNFQPTYNSATNRYASLPGTTVSYDSAGNLLSDGTNTFAWDAFGKAINVRGHAVTYDAFGNMVEADYPSEFFYSPDGAAYILFKGQTARQASYYLPGGAQAIYDEANGGLILYRHADYLGNVRANSTPSRTFSYTQAYAPFGEPYAQSSVNIGTFAGLSNTFSLDLYDTPNREYSDVGRWSSPDPAGLAAVDPASPQSWNRYAYVLNSPLNATDPYGLFCVWDNGSYDANDDPSTGSYDKCQGPNGAGGTWFNGDPSNWWLSSDWSSEANGEVAEWAAEINPNGVGPAGPSDSSTQVFATPDFFATAGSRLPSAVCMLMSPLGSYSLGTGAVPLFQPQMAAPLTAAIINLNAFGIKPTINDGFRTAADQSQRLLHSGPLPALKVSLHQEGLAVDVKIDKNFGATKNALTQQGLTWGGPFKPKSDPVHFQLPPAGTKADLAMIAACGGN
jgi:RHS repeat-associated protein